MKKSTILLLAIIAVVFSSCGNGGENPEPKITPKQLVFTSAEEQLQYRTNEFSMNMLSMIGRDDMKDKNVCFSPLSASMALGILMNGADGNTLSQMQKALGFEGLDQADINTYYHKLIEALPALDETTIVKIANALWLHEHFPFNPDYQKQTREVFAATIENVSNFADKATLNKINKWASDNTNGLITKVIDETMVNDLTVMIFANALYFKGIWADEFDKRLTEKMPFTLLSGEKKDVDMMQRFDDLLYCENDMAQMVELNYKGGKYAMDLLLPKTDVSMDKLLASLNLDQWNEYLKQLYHWDVSLRLPKFKFSYKRNLKGDLVATGISDAFSAGNADFSKLSDRATFLSWIYQYCYIAVDEEGTEAAAVTIGGVEGASAPLEPKRFYADHPFVFVIREKQYGTILFSGVVTNPEY